MPSGKRVSRRAQQRRGTPRPDPGRDGVIPVSPGRWWSRVYVTQASALVFTPRPSDSPLCTPLPDPPGWRMCGPASDSGLDQLVQGVSSCHSSARPGKAAAGAFPSLGLRPHPGISSPLSCGVCRGPLHPQRMRTFKGSQPWTPIPPLQLAALAPGVLGHALNAQIWWPRGPAGGASAAEGSPAVECPSGPSSERGPVRPQLCPVQWGLGEAASAAVEMSAPVWRCHSVWLPLLAPGWPCGSASGCLVCPGNRAPSSEPRPLRSRCVC